jgi:hypothetical protein
MVVQRWRLRGLAISRGNAVYAAPLSGSDHGTCPTLVGGMIEQPANIVNKEWIQLVGDLLLVGEIQCSIERDPCGLLVDVHQKQESTYQTPLRCIGPILTTWRTFSLFRIPSLRPRVMPATLSNFVPLII